MLDKVKTLYSAKDKEIDFDVIRGTLHKSKGPRRRLARWVTRCRPACELHEKNEALRRGPTRWLSSRRVEILAEFLTVHGEAERAALRKINLESINHHSFDILFIGMCVYNVSREPRTTTKPTFFFACILQTKRRQQLR